jgi:hypothetical protein
MLPSFYNHDCGMLFTYTFGMNAFSYHLHYLNFILLPVIQLKG